MTHMIAPQFIDGLNSYHKSSAEQGDWFGVQGRVEAVFIPFIFFKSHSTRQANRRKSTPEFDGRGFNFKILLTQRGKISIASGEAK